MSDYLHGSSPKEQARLVLMNEILNRRAVEEIKLVGDERILEMGCGTGVFACALARGAPAGRVLAIERDARQLETAKRLGQSIPNLRFRSGDALDPPLGEDEWASFDLAHTRFLLEHVTDPLAVVRAMVRAVRPGGRLVLVDDDHALMQLFPEPAGFMRLWSSYVALYDARGNDPFVGRRLVSLLHEAGARPVRSTLFFYGGCAGDEGFGSVVENLAQVFEGAAGPIAALGDGRAIDAQEMAEIVAAFREWGRRPDAALWYALPWAEGVR